MKQEINRRKNQWRKTKRKKFEDNRGWVGGFMWDSKTTEAAARGGEKVNREEVKVNKDTEALARESTNKKKSSIIISSKRNLKPKCDTRELLSLAKVWWRQWWMKITTTKGKQKRLTDLRNMKKVEQAHLISNLDHK